MGEDASAFVESLGAKRVVREAVAPSAPHPRSSAAAASSCVPSPAARGWMEEEGENEAQEGQAGAEGGAESEADEVGAASRSSGSRAAGGGSCSGSGGASGRAAAGYQRRKLWTQLEVKWLQQGVIKHGVGKWSTIR